MAKHKKNTKVKVVFTESLYKAKTGESVLVAPGYARYLVRYGFAMREKGNEDIINKRLAAWQAADAQKIEDARQAKEQLSQINLVIERKSGFSGILYGSVNASDVAKELQKLGCNIVRKDIVMESIRSTGKYMINVNLYGGEKTTMALVVNAESE